MIDKMINKIVYGLLLVVILLVSYLLLPGIWASLVIIAYIMVGAYLIDPRPLLKGEHKRHERKH